MYIRCTNPQTESIKLPWMDEPVAFASTGTAQVDQDTGARLVDELDDIEPYDEPDTETNE
jgi:hypothetical protein